MFVILDQFTTKKPQWGVRELAARTGLSPNLTHWYLKNLEKTRAVRKNPETNKYELGFRLFELGSRVGKFSIQKNISYPILEKLSRTVNGTVVLRVLDDAELYCVVAVESPSSFRVHHSEGTRLPCNFGSVGKLLMAHLDKKEGERLVREGHVCKFTKNTITEPQALRKEWDKIRRRGWAYSSGEAIDGARAIAVPVRNASGEVCAGIGVTVPAMSLPKSRVKTVVRQAMKAAQEVSLELGWQTIKANRRNGR